MASNMQMYSQPPMQTGGYDQYAMASKQDVPSQDGFLEEEEEGPKPEPLETWIEIGSQALFWFCFLICAIAKPERHWLVLLAAVISWLWAVSAGLDSNKWSSKFGVLTFTFGICAGAIELVLGETTDWTRWLCIAACLLIALKYLFVIVLDISQTLHQLAVTYGKTEFGARVYWWFCVSSFFFWLGLMALITVELMDEEASGLQKQIKKEEGLLN